MKQAAGILFVAASGDVLLMRRTGRPGQDADCAGCWSLPGGGIEEGEDAEQAARREVKEETGLVYTGPVKLLTRRVKDDVDFTTFLAIVGEKFVPKLNDEHDTFGWIPRSFAITSPDLHPGLYVTLQRFDMDELAVAKAIRDGELVSPQYYNQHLMLVALRITGTGVSYRPAHDEYVMRDPKIYMNQEFCDRCNGLQVIMHHPHDSLLNTQEFRDRSIGAIFLPYLKPEAEEVWGIAKIHDMEAAKLLETEQMSTSPAVYGVGDAKIEVPDGRTLLIEDKPVLLDHLAVLLGTPGVWDKGKGLSGVESVDAEASGDDPFAEVLRQIQLNDIVNRL